MVRILGLLALAFWPTVAVSVEPSADYYVAPNGNDTWSGTRATPNAGRTDGPFATPARARDAVRAARPAKPVTVLLRGGRYELAEPFTLTPADSGTKAAPRVFAAYPGETPVLSGGHTVKPHVENGLWIVPVPDAKLPIRQISVGGELRLASRWPKNGQFTIAGLAGANPRAKYNTPADKFEFTEGQIDPAWKNLADLEVVVLHFWVAGHYRIKSVDHKSHVVTLDRSSLRKFTEDGSGNALGRFYLSNVPVLDPGEFYQDRAAGVIRYKPKPGEMPSSHAVVVPRRDAVVRFAGKPQEGAFVEHVELRGLTLADSTFDIGSKSAGDLQAEQHVPGSVHLRGANHCVIADCRLLHLGGYGIELTEGCRDNLISSNEIAHLAAGGIRVSGGGAKSPEAARTGGNTISDNHLHHLGEVFHAGIGVLSQHADSNHILHNHIHHLYYTGISVGWVWGYAESVSRGNRIEGNLIHDVGQKLLSDMGGIYLLGVSPGTVVRGNVVRDVESFGYGGWGLYTDEGSTGIVLENNLVYRTKSGGFHQHYGKENVIRNNIFALARTGQLIRTRAEPHKSFTFERNIVYANGTPLFVSNWNGDGFTIDYNLYWDASNKEPAFPGGKFAGWQKRGHDHHSLLADPQFVDPAKGDFRLKPGSPAEKIGFQPFDSSTAGIRPKNQRNGRR